MGYAGCEDKITKNFYCPPHLSIWLSFFKSSWLVHLKNVGSTAELRSHVFMPPEKLSKLLDAATAFKYGASKPIQIDISPNGKYLTELAHCIDEEACFLLGSRGLEFETNYKQVKIRNIETFIECLEQVRSSYEKLTAPQPTNQVLDALRDEETRDSFPDYVPRPCYASKMTYN